MMKKARALLSDGREIDYIITDNPPTGGMKHTFFSTDGKYALSFFNNPKYDNEPLMHERLSAIIGRYNPTLSEKNGGSVGNDEKSAAYFGKLFCWPQAVIVKPRFGILSPVYPQNFFFSENSSDFINLSGKDKKSSWFINRNRRLLNPDILGDFRNMLSICIFLARSIRRIHQAGLAHSDLSANNVLIDPETGSCVIIDTDSLVVPNLYPPEVIGTRGYIAPEILSEHKGRVFPSVLTDLHSLAVLIYQYLFFRHPLDGIKINADNAELDDFLSFGEKALFIENPFDQSNRPPKLYVTIKDMGIYLEKMFARAFVDGLHCPDKRPSAMEWEHALVKTWDMLHSCSNPACPAKYFVLYDTKNPICPFCKSKISDKQILKLSIMSQSRTKNGIWLKTGSLIAENYTPLCKWHIFSGIYPCEKTDRSIYAYIRYDGNNWYIVNNSVNSMIAPCGTIVPKGSSALLKNGYVFRASKETGSVLIEVSIENI